MDLNRFGSRLKWLRKGQGLTQEQFAEHFGVSGRTVSRWETGSNLPDVDILLEIAAYYRVELGALLLGEVEEDTMNEQLSQTVRQVADYTSEEQLRQTQRMHGLFLAGVGAFGLYLVCNLPALGGVSLAGPLADLALGFAFGVLITGVVFTSRRLSKLRALKLRLGKK